MHYGKNTRSWHCDVTKGTGQEQVSQVSSINSQHVRAKYVIFCNVRDNIFFFFND